MKYTSLSPKRLIVLELQKLHHFEERRRQWVVELLVAVHVDLSDIKIDVFLQTHESTADQNRHVIVAQHDHRPYFMRGILALLLRAFHEQIVNLETAILDLLFCLFSFDQNGACLWVVFAVECLQIGSGVFVTLVDDADGIEKSWSFDESGMVILEVGVDFCDVGSLEQLNIEDALDV